MKNNFTDGNAVVLSMDFSIRQSLDPVLIPLPTRNVSLGKVKLLNFLGLFFSWEMGIN